MPAPPDPARQALRKEVEEATRDALVRYGPTGAQWRHTVVKQFEGRGASLATLWRWIGAIMEDGQAATKLVKLTKQAAQ